MPKIVMNWRLRLVKYLENRAKKEKQTEFEISKETILHTLLNNLKTEDSIKLFEVVKEDFYSKMKKRLVEVSKEKVALEEFVCDK